MTLAETMATVLWLGVGLYAVFGGADFGGGFWDLFAGSATKGAPTRKLIESSIGPVWEANHVWLIFAIVVLWTGFPPAFTAAMTTLWIPLTLACFGVILRGGGFVFRKASVELAEKRLFGAAFALSSVVTPFFLGAAGGAVASGRVPRGNATGDPIASWLGPTSLLGGTLAILASAHLAAVFLAGDATRTRHAALERAFRFRAILSGVAVGATGLLGLLILRADAPRFFEGLVARALPVIELSFALGLFTLVAVYFRQHVLARPLAAGAVMTVILAWALSQYPDLLPGHLTLDAAAAPDPVLRALLISLAVGALILIPSLILLFRVTGSARRSQD